MMQKYSLPIGENLTIQHVGEFYMECLKQLSEDSPIEIDISEVMAVDTAGVQFLLGLFKHAKVYEHEIVFTAGSPKLMACIKQLGLQEQLSFKQN